MSERKTHFMSIYFINNKGQFKDYKEIKKVADALKQKLEYIKKTEENYFINACICMSNMNIRYANLKYVENRKKGKNKLVIVPKNRYKSEPDKYMEPWHLHILIEANPAETVGQMIVDYFNKKFGREIAWKNKVDDGFFDYVLKQSIHQRFVKETRDTNLVGFDFKREYEKYGKPKTKARKAREKLVMKKFDERSQKIKLKD